jgi:hypothetical protein
MKYGFLIAALLLSSASAFAQDPAQKSYTSVDELRIKADQQKLRDNERDMTKMREAAKIATPGDKIGFLDAIALKEEDDKVIKAGLPVTKDCPDCGRTPENLKAVAAFKTRLEISLGEVSNLSLEDQKKKHNECVVHFKHTNKNLSEFEKEDLTQVACFQSSAHSGQTQAKATAPTGETVSAEGAPAHATDLGD